MPGELPRVAKASSQPRRVRRWHEITRVEDDTERLNRQWWCECGGEKKGDGCSRKSRTVRRQHDDRISRRCNRNGEVRRAEAWRDGQVTAVSADTYACMVTGMTGRGIDRSRRTGGGVVLVRWVVVCCGRRDCDGTGLVSGNLTSRRPRNHALQRDRENREEEPDLPPGPEHPGKMSEGGTTVKFCG